jgi:hypothetical protein
MSSVRKHMKVCCLLTCVTNAFRVATSSAVSLLENVPERKEWPKIRLGKGGVSYASARKKRFGNADQACGLLKINFRNGVPARSVRKCPWLLATRHSQRNLERAHISNSYQGFLLADRQYTN